MASQNNFNLTRQFAIISFVSILAIAAVSAFLLSGLFTDRMLERDAAISQEFLDSIVTADRTWRFFEDPDNSASRYALQEFFDHVAAMPDVVRANVYSSDGRVLWSSDASLIGRTFADNDELIEALEGQLDFESGIIGDTEKTEHTQFEEGLTGMRFIETYVPIWNDNRYSVVGAVELYKLPRALQESITDGQRLIWLSALVGGAILFLTLYWVVRRAALVMEDQQHRLLETRSLSMIGETASAVAHAMRNPLASIRASAELTLMDDLEGARESAQDIISEADRLDGWARDLLQFSASRKEEPEPVSTDELVADVVREHNAVLGSPSIRLTVNLAKDLPPVIAHPAPLSQVLGNLVMNAVEAMGGAGHIVISTALDKRRRQVVISVRDSGPGLAPEIQDKLFRPFATTKPTGTGLGLALSQRLLEHYDGWLALESTAQGVVASIHLPAGR